jgi:hypothetical protein
MQRRRRDARGFRRCRERSAFVPVHPGEVVTTLSEILVYYVTVT